MSSSTIAMIAPVSPFRGGIAQHSTMLANALSEVADTRVISFSRLYPRWLYPGRFQTEDSSLDVKPDTRFLLDALNPLSWLRVAKDIEAQRPTCVLIPWWTFFLAPCFGWLARRFRRSRIPVLFVCHNVVDHEAAYWKRMLARMVLRQGAGFVVQARGEQERLRNLLGPVPVLYHPLPIFDQFPAARNALPRRADLELLFYGFIRPYKGLDVLLDAMRALRGEPVFLSIVGEPWGEGEAVWRKRIHDAGLEAQVEFVPRYVTDEETAEYFARADAVVLPYRTATGTAVVAAAYHYRKPVVATSVGGLRDVVIEGQTGLLVPPDDPEKLSAAIREFMKTGIPDADANIGELTETMTWQHLVKEMLEFVRSVVVPA